MFSDDILDLVREDLVWKTEVEAKWRTESIEDFALDDDGSIWLLVQNRPGDYKDPQSYEVRHLTAPDLKVYQFPSHDSLFSDGSLDFDPSHPAGITITNENRPRVSFFLVNPTLVWTGSQWEWAEPLYS